jgi:RNA polymerase sigma-70 factor (ECF subfamily)
MNGNLDRDLVFRRIYDETFGILLRVALKIVLDQDVAEEMCHDAYIKIYHRLEQFPDTDQAKYWLIRVVKNQALNHAKRKVRERRAYERVLLESRKHSESAESQYLKVLDSETIQRALQRLPDNMKSILVMKEYTGLSYREIAQSLGISEANVKVRMFRARQKLALTMEETANGR